MMHTFLDKRETRGWIDLLKSDTRRPDHIDIELEKKMKSSALGKRGGCFWDPGVFDKLNNRCDFEKTVLNPERITKTNREISHEDRNPGDAISDYIYFVK